MNSLVLADMIVCKDQIEPEAIRKLAHKTLSRTQRFANC
jgi:hypothetical protein